jgi:hypothetical protein
MPYAGATKHEMRGSDMKEYRKLFLSILITAAMLFSLSSCIPVTIHLEDEDESSEETSKDDEDETSSDEPTEDAEDETTATEPVEEPSLSTEDKVNAMYYVISPLAYVLTYESETHEYDPEDVNFVASTLFIASSMFSTSGIFRTAVWNSEGYLEVPYAEMEELGHACFSVLLDDITSGDDYERMSYDASAGIFYVGGGDGFYDASIETFRELSDGSIEVTFDVWDPDDGTLAARYIFILIDNEYSQTIEAPLFPCSVEEVTFVA